MPGLDPDASFSRYDLDAQPVVVLAVSGGSDSTALMLLARRWFSAHAPGVRLVAMTIDHGLRPESAAEAAAVAELATRLGIEHRTLFWTGVKPGSGLQAAAREARYRLLAEAAQQAGAARVLTGHTLDDQLETVAMRSLRGEGPGLAGMAPATLYDGRVWIVRPLLGLRRAALRDMLTRQGIGWIDDPSNENPAYERARQRSAMAGPATAPDPSMIEAAGKARLHLATRAAVLVERHATTVASGLVRLSPEFATSPDAEAALLALRALLATIGGREHPPEAERARLLLASLAKPGRSTLSRAVVDVRKAGIYLLRERRGLPEPAEVVDGAVWDGRFRLRLAAGESRAMVAAGSAAAPGSDSDEPPAVPASLLRAAAAAEPRLFRVDGSGIPAPGGSALERLVSPWARFLPCFDYALAEAVARRIGAAAFPAPPFAGHNEAKA
jgi:tRNA(Ile)-lysidine synthase